MHFDLSKPLTIKQRLIRTLQLDLVAHNLVKKHRGQVPQDRLHIILNTMSQPEKDFFLQDSIPKSLEPFRCPRVSIDQAIAIVDNTIRNCRFKICAIREMLTGKQGAFSLEELGKRLGLG